MGNLFSRVKYLFWGMAILWTGIIVASLVWNFREQKEKIFEIALNSAYLTFEKDVIYRRWVAQQGGVFVPVSKYTPPNPYLKLPERDIFTSSGSPLTLVNPAYMTRQINEMAPNIHSQSHITSLNPIRPQNGPDPWETSALRSFEKGSKEVSSVDKVAGEDICVSCALLSRKKPVSNVMPHKGTRKETSVEESASPYRWRLSGP